MSDDTPTASAAPEPGRSVLERIGLSRQEAESIERDILIRRHIERYAIVRQFAYGRTLDCACGVGYGTHLLAKNSDITKIYGLDSDSSSIAHARREFSGDRIEFINADINADIADVILPDIDFLVSIETIEHLPDPRVQEIMVTFPAKKTTHYNKHHYWDLTVQDVVDIFTDDFVMIHNFSYTFDTGFVYLARLKRSGARHRRFKRSHREP